MIEVLDPGPLATIQDLGRPGHAALGLPVGGAADRSSLRLANRIVGNHETAAGIEVTFGPFRVQFGAAAIIAVTGAPCAVTVGPAPVGMNAPLHVPAGAVVTLGSASAGTRSYLAVRGGIDAPVVLGSRSSVLVARIGLPALAHGVKLAVGHEVARLPNIDLAPVAGVADDLTLTGIWGPRDDCFDPTATAMLTTGAYEVTTDSNRVGIRLRGPALPPSSVRDLPSEPTVPGAVEVPPNGQPIVFLVDHPTTCGYPVIAVVDRDCLDAAAQLRPGTRVRFRLTSESRFL